MQSPPRYVHFINGLHGIEYAELDRQLLGMVRLNTRLRLRKEELFEALMPKTLDRATIIYRIAWLYAINSTGISQIPKADYNSPMPTHQTTLASSTGAAAIGSLSTGALAIGALALGAFAVGALAIGALAIRKLAIGKARVRELRIDRLTVGRLDVQSTRESPTR